MTTSQNSYFTIVTRYITIMTNFSIFLKDLFPRMASNYVTKITTFRNDYFPKMKTFPYLVHSQNYYFPKMTTTFPELLLSQNDHFPRRTTFPKLQLFLNDYFPKIPTTFYYFLLLLSQNDYYKWQWNFLIYYLQRLILSPYFSL